MVKGKDSSKLTDKAEEEAQIKKSKKAWIKNDVSQELEKYDEDLEWFEKKFPNRRTCEKQLLFWLGWKSNSSDSTFVCPFCEGTDAIADYKPEGKDKKLRFVFYCKNENCGQTPSREDPAKNIPSLINVPVFKQRFPKEATSILTQGAANSVKSTRLPTARILSK